MTARLLKPGMVLVALLACLGGPPTSLAQYDPAWTWNRHEIFVSTTGAVTTTRGWEFTVNETITVTAIGVFDDEVNFNSPATEQSFPGLAQAHEVALWDVSDTSKPLSSGIVLADQASTLCQDGYRYAPIDPTTLTPGNNYVAAVFWPGDDGSGNFDPYPDTQSSGATITVDPRINLVQARFKLFGGPFEFPGNGQGGDTSSYLGMMNFRIERGACEPNPPADLMTTFQGGNGQAGNMFDLRALHPEGLTVDGWQINLSDDVTNDTLINVAVYWREGSHVGHTSSPDGWNLLGEIDVLSWGDNQAAPVPLGGLVLPFNETIGFFITTDFITDMPPPLSPPPLNYTNIGPALPGYANDDLELTGGVGKANPLFVGQTFPNRMWNGGVRYRVGTCPADLTGDGTVGVADLLALFAAWGTPDGDITGDGTTDVADLLALFASWGPCP